MYASFEYVSTISYKPSLDGKLQRVIFGVPPFFIVFEYVKKICGFLCKKIKILDNV